MNTLLFVISLILIVPWIYIYVMFLLLPFTIILSSAFHFVRASMNNIWNKINVISFSSYLGFMLNEENKFQNVCACVKSKLDGVKEFRIHLIGNEFEESYKVTSSSLHQAVTDIHKQFVKGMSRESRCGIEECRGCKHCNTVSRKLLFEIDRKKIVRS